MVAMKPVDRLRDTKDPQLPGQMQRGRVPSVSEVVDFDAVVNHQRPPTSERQKKMLEEPENEHTAAEKKEKNEEVRIDERMKEMERKAHIISTLAAVSCLLAFVIREYRVANNVTWVFCLFSLSRARARSLSAWQRASHGVKLS